MDMAAATTAVSALNKWKKKASITEAAPAPAEPAPAASHAAFIPYRDSGVESDASICIQLTVWQF
jgi:hypothetical protein